MAVNEGIKTSETKSDKFEVQIEKNIQKFLSEQSEPFTNLDVSRYDGTDTKFYSDIKITNPKNEKTIWVEVKKDKYANLGGPSFKYIDGKWSCTTTDDENHLTQLYLDALEKGSEKFISFCKKYLKTDDINIPKDLSPELINAWKKSGSVDDTENDVQFITNKVPLEDFGEKIAEYYKTAKYEPVYYIQVGDELYIIDKEYNPLGLKTKTDEELKSISEAYRIGRIQFRAKGIDKKLKDGNKYYYSIVCDVKILADDEKDESEYNCSFKTEEKWPALENIQQINESDDNIQLITNVSSDEIENILDTAKIENKRFERIQFSKYLEFGGDNYNWCVLKNNDEPLAVALLNDNTPFKDYYLVAEIQTLKKGCGKILLQEIIKQYKKVWLMANTTAGEDLLNYYRSLKLNEIVVPESVYECPAYFFCSNDCDIEKLENYIIAFYSNEEEVDESKKNVMTEHKQFFHRSLKLLMEDWIPEYDNKEFNQFGEKWQKLPGDDSMSLIVDEIVRDCQVDPDETHNEDSISLGSLHKVDGGHYIATLHGGCNGGGSIKRWITYLALIKKLVKKLFEQFGDVWLLDLKNDCLDDVWTVRICFKDIKTIEKQEQYNDVMNILNDMYEVENIKSTTNEADSDIGGKKSDTVPKNGVKIWIDDIRQAPEGFLWIKSVNDFIDYCYKNGIDDVTLIDTDHDAGDFQKDGGDYIRCFDYLEFCGCENITIHIHSANPVGANNIRRIISKNKDNGWKEIRNS